MLPWFIYSDLLLGNIARNVDQNRTRTAGSGDIECFSDDAWKILRILYENIVFGDRCRDAGDVGFLERVGPDKVLGNLTGDRNNRDRIHIGRGNPGDQIGRPRAARSNADTYGVLCTCVATRFMHCPLFLTDKNIVDRALIKSVKYFQQGTTWISENIRYAFISQCLN